MVEVVGIRQLRADAAAMMRRAGAGERIVVTVAGRAVAELGPVGHDPAGVTIEGLVAIGAVIPPRRFDPYRPAQPTPIWRGARLDRLLREVRG